MCLRKNCWHADTQRHSEAAKKGWEKRRTTTIIKEKVHAQTQRTRQTVAKNLKESPLQVTYREAAGTIAVASPFSPTFPQKARGLGGQWDALKSVWVFDSRLVPRVKALYLEHYGWWIDPVEVVNIIVNKVRDESEVWLGSRLLACRKGRDYSVKLGPGVFILTGGFPPWGSKKHPSLDPDKGTTLELLDVPLSLAKQWVSKNPDGITIDKQGKGFKANPTSSWNTMEAKKVLQRARKIFGRHNVNSLGAALSLLANMKIKSNPTKREIVIGYRKGHYKNQSGYFYPVVDGQTPSSAPAYKTPTGALNYARRVAEQYRKQHTHTGIKIIVAGEISRTEKKQNWGPGCKTGQNPTMERPNPAIKHPRDIQSHPVKIYDNILSLEAQKGSSSLWPNEQFRHDFKAIKGKASVYGLSDGSLLIKGKKRLWKKFNYPTTTQ